MFFCSSKFSDGGGRHIFEEKGIIYAQNPQIDIEKATEDAIESGAEDVNLDEDHFEFICAESSFQSVQNNLVKKDYLIASADIEFIPLKRQSLSEEDLQVCLHLYDKLEALPEVIKLHNNVA